MSIPAAVRRLVAADESSAARPRAVAAALLAADAAFAFQQTAIVPAVHTVQQSLGGSAEWSAWLVTVYLIVATVATPAMGRLADLHGRRRLLIIGLVVFMLGSAAGAVAPDMPALLLFRAIQGVGGSVYPLTLATARRVLPPERVGTVIALSAGAFGFGTLLGFGGGGLLAQYASWRWIFGAGAILVAAATTILLRALPPSQGQASGGYDLRGTVILGFFAIALLIGLTLIVSLGWTSLVVWVLLAGSVAAGGLWGRLETRTRDPLIDLHALREPVVLRSNLASIALGWALFSSYLLLPEFALASPGTVHYGLGAGAALTGAVMLPLAAGQTIAAPLAGWASRRVSTRAVFATGLTILAAALAALSAIRRDEALLAVTLFAFGAGAGTALQTGSALATEEVSSDVAAASSALNSTIRRLAGGIGGQVATILLATFTTGSGSTPSRFTPFVVAYLVAMALCLCGTAVLMLRTGGQRRR